MFRRILLVEALNEQLHVPVEEVRRLVIDSLLLLSVIDLLRRRYEVGRLLADRVFLFPYGLAVLQLEIFLFGIRLVTDALYGELITLRAQRLHAKLVIFVGTQQDCLVEDPVVLFHAEHLEVVANLREIVPKLEPGSIHRLLDRRLLHGGQCHTRFILQRLFFWELARFRVMGLVRRLLG